MIVMAVYVTATTIAWSIKETFAGPLPLWLFIALGIGSAIGGIFAATSCLRRSSTARD